MGHARDIAILLVVGACGSHPVRRAAPDAAPPPPPPRPTHAIFDLGDNRLLAHQARGGAPVLDARSPAFVEYLHFERPRSGWRLEKGRAFASPGATFDVPLDAPATRIWLRVRTEKPTELALADGPPSHAEPGWSTVELDGAIPAGEPRLTLAFAGPPVEVAWLQVGGERPPDELAPIWDPAARAFTLAPGDSLTWTVAIPPGARLAYDTTCPVSTTPIAPPIARLAISAPCAARITNARLVVDGDEPPSRRGPPPKHVILWILDAMRADKLRPFNPSARAEAPHFEELARSAALFRTAWSQGDESRVAHASLWTSLYPAAHGMITPTAKLDRAVPTLADTIKRAGLATVGVTGNGFVFSYWGFGKGWDSFSNHLQEERPLSGGAILADALGRTDEVHAKPFFLYLGTIDTHVTWRGHQPWLDRYDPGPYTGRYTLDVPGADVDRGVQPTPRDLQRVVAIYDSDVSYQDELLGELEDRLAAWGIADDTMLIVTADHGDELWEEGRAGHGQSLAETVVHVPLLVAYPPLVAPGVRDDAAELVDVLPTICDALGLPVPEGAQGESLLAPAGAYPRAAFTTRFEEDVALRVGDWKLLVDADGRARLFDLATDPGERTPSEDATARRLVADPLALFLAHERTWKKSRWGTAANVTRAFADDLESADSR